MYTILRLRQGHAPDPVSHLLARLLECFPDFAEELRTLNGGRSAVMTLADSEDHDGEWLTHKQLMLGRLRPYVPALSFCTAAGYDAEVDTAIFGWLVDIRELDDAPTSTDITFSAPEISELAALGLGFCTTVYHPYSSDERSAEAVTLPPAPPHA